MKTAAIFRVSLRLSALAIALGLGWVFPGSAQTTNVVFNDTFEPDAVTAATRQDDLGAGFGSDIQWRPRVTNQGGAYSVVDDPVFGNALRFYYNANNLWIIGQFDSDASDGITLGSSSVPASLGGSVGDMLIFSMQIRVTNTLGASGSFRPGLMYIPAGPLAADQADNSWINTSVGYFVSIPNGTPGLVPTYRATAAGGGTPYGGANSTQLTNGLTGVTVGFGADTNAHTLVMQLTRGALWVQIDSYWDGNLVSSAVDGGVPVNTFNSIEVLYGLSTGYIFDNVKLIAVGSDVPPPPPPTKTWTGATSASWANPDNWSPAGSPAGSNVLYSSSSTANLTQTLDQNWTVIGLTVSNVGGPVTITPGFTLTNSGGINMAGAGADLTILADYVSGGAASVAAGRTLTLSNLAGGNLNNSAGPGTLRLTGRAVPGQVLDTAGSLKMIVDGGVISASPPVRLTAEAGGTVKLIVTNNGTVELTGSSTKLNIGNNASTTGTNILTMESGTIAVGASTGTGATANNGIFVANNNCYGVFNLNGGLVVLTNKQTDLTNIASETTLRIPGNTAGNGTVNLNGGTLVVPMIDGAAGSGVLNFNGTTVVANRSNNVWIAGVGIAYVLAGGAIFETADYDVTVSQSLAAPLSGTSGGLTKQGSGILRLTGFNSYSGATVVGGGTLAASAASGAYPASSPLVVSNGVTLNLDVSGGTTAFMPAVAFNGATLNLNYDSLFGNPTAAAINNNTFTGVALSGTGMNTINILGSGFTAGDVPLIDYSGAIGGSGFAAFKLGSLPLGMSGALINDTVNSVIVLHLNRAPNSLVWYGDKSPNWDSSSANWNSGALAYTEVGGLGDIVTFDDTFDFGKANTNINLTIALHPVTVTVNGYSAAYKFGGAGKLSGQGTLCKDGTGSLTLTTANDFTGGSFLTNGAVYLGSDAALGAGRVTLAGATVSSDGSSGRTLTNAVLFAAPMSGSTSGTFGDGIYAGSITLSGPIDWGGGARSLRVNNNLILSGSLGNGGLDVKTGPGTLTFQGATDATTAGNLQIEDGSVIVSSGTLDRASGGIRIMALNSSSQRAYFGVVGGATVLLDGPNINLRVGSDAGDPSSTNILDIAGTVSCTANDLTGSVMIGTNCALAQLNLRAGGLLRIGSFAAQGPNSEVSLYGGTLAGVASHSRFMQGLGACYVRSGGMTIDAEGSSGEPITLTIAQALLDGGGGGGLTKTGHGTLILTGTNAYGGNTVVDAGTLQIGAGQMPPGAVTVADGATLGLAPVAPGLTVPLGTVTLGSVTGACLAVSFPGMGTPTLPAASVNSLTLKGTVPVQVQVSGVEEGVIPLVRYTSLQGGGGVSTGGLPEGLLGYVTNDTIAKVIELVVTRAPAATALFSDTFEPDGATAATRNDDSGSGFGLDIQWRPRGNNQGANYSVTNDPVLGNAMQFNTGSSQFLFSIGQFDSDAADGVTFESNSVPVTLGGNVGESLRFSMDIRTTAKLSTGYAFKFGLMMAPNGPTPIDTTTGNAWTANWLGYALSMNNGNPGRVTSFKEYPTYDTSDSLLKTGTNVIFLTNEIANATAAMGADTNKHRLVMQLTRVTASSLLVEAYWDNTLVFTALDTNAPPFTNFNSVAVSYGQAGVYVYDNVALNKVRALAPLAAGDDAYTLGANSTLTVAAPGLLANDSDPSGYPLLAVQASGPAHGTLSLDTDGGFSYTPATDYSGADSFSYQANNGYIGSPVTMVSLTITNASVVAPVVSAYASGSNLILSGTGGTPGASAFMLTSTNVALPMSNWTTAASILLDSAGNFTFTNAIDPAQPQQFFRVQVP